MDTWAGGPSPSTACVHCNSLASYQTVRRKHRRCCAHLPMQREKEYVVRADIPGVKKASPQASHAALRGCLSVLALSVTIPSADDQLRVGRRMQARSHSSHRW